jgi:hypothetical protein
MDFRCDAGGMPTVAVMCLVAWCDALSCLVGMYHALKYGLESFMHLLAAVSCSKLDASLSYIHHESESQS